MACLSGWWGASIVQAARQLRSDGGEYFSSLLLLAWCCCSHCRISHSRMCILGSPSAGYVGVIPTMRCAISAEKKARSCSMPNCWRQVELITICTPGCRRITASNLGRWQKQTSLGVGSPSYWGCSTPSKSKKRKFTIGEVITGLLHSIRAW